MKLKRQLYRAKMVWLRGVMLFSAVLLFCCVSASAEEISVAQANKNACRTAEYALNDLIDAYQNMETDTHSDRWSGVERAIVRYGKNRVAALVEDERYQTESLIEEIERYRASGEVAGEVTWVYYTYVDEMPESCRERITQAYETICAEIEAVTLMSQTEICRTFANHGFVSRMYVAIFDEKLDLLIQEEDSQAVRDKVTAAKQTIRGDDCLPLLTGEVVCTLPDMYVNVYESCVKAVKVQRWQDTAMTILEDVFAILYPDVTAVDHEGMKNALTALDDDGADTVAVLNERMTQAISDLLNGLDSLEGAYVDAYIAGLEADMAEKVTASNASDRIADVLPFFGNHALLYAKAYAKDTLNAYVADKGLTDDGRMKDLADTYNRPGGLFDTCGTQEAINDEVARAKLRVDLRDEYLYAEDMITRYGGEGEGKQELLDAIETEYLAADAKLSTNNPRPTWEECLDIYADCLEVFDEATAEAEVVAFLSKHQEIIEKPEGEVTVADKDKLDAAVADVEAMNEHARDILLDKQPLVAASLANKYIRAAKEQVQIYLDDDLRSYHVPALKDALDQMTLPGNDPDHLSVLVAEVDAIVCKAACIDAVYDVWESIEAAEDYATFPEVRKGEMKKIADDAAYAMVELSVTGGEGVQETLRNMANGAALGMYRAAAYARLEVKAAREGQTEETKAAIGALVAETKAAVAGVDDPATIATLTEEALFEMDKIYAEQDVNAMANQATTEILGKGFLSQDEMAGYIEQVQTSLETVLSSLGEAETEADVTTALNDMTKRMEGLLADVALEDKTQEETEKSQALTQAQTDCNRVVAHINDKVYLSEDDRTTFLSRVETMCQTTCDQIRGAVTAEAVQTAVKVLGNHYSEMKQEVDAKDVATAEALRAEARTALEARNEKIALDMEQLMYLSRESKNGKRVELAGTLSAGETAIEQAVTPAEIQAAKQTALGALEALWDEAVAEDLSEAKQTAINRLLTEKKEVDTVVDGYRYLDDDSVAELAAYREVWYSDSVAAIQAAATVDDVHRVRDDYSQALATHAMRAQDMEDEACVKTLSPFIIVLTCFLIVELAALAVLFLLRRRQRRMMQVAGYMPITALPVVGLMLTPVSARVILVLLVVIDVAMVPFIVWLAMQLWKNRIVVQLEKDDSIRVLEEPKDYKRKELPDPGTVERLETPKLIYLMPPVEVMPEIVQAITVEEADELISDEDALHCEASGMEDTEVYRGRKKAEINIDVLSRFFDAGETVTLNSMKRKGLLPRSVGYVKVLARGRLDKPITVIAQGFSASAVKMIVLTGGKAILTEGAPERWTWRRSRR